MQELEKVLEEMKESSIMVATSKEHYIHPQDRRFVEEVVLLNDVEEIIRKHLPRENGQEIMGIKIRDNETGEIFEYGTNIHHALRISKNGGCLTFENLQNGDGSSKSGDGGYSFVLNDGKTPEESSSPDSMYGATYANIGGFHEHLSRENAPEITRSSRDNKCGECSRRKWYMKGYEDALKEDGVSEAFLEDCKRVAQKYKKDNDGWIPVEERLPEEDGTYLCTLDGELCGIEEPFTGMCGIEDRIWDEPDCVLAWRPLPEPYRQNKQRRVKGVEEA